MMSTTSPALPSLSESFTCILDHNLFTNNIDRQRSLASNLNKIINVGVKSSELYANIVLFDASLPAPKNYNLPLVCFHWADDSCKSRKRLPFEAYHGRCYRCEEIQQPVHRSSGRSGGSIGVRCFLHRTLFQTDHERRKRLCANLVRMAQVDLVSSEKYADIVLYDGSGPAPTDCTVSCVCYHWATMAEKLVPPKDFEKPCVHCHRSGTTNDDAILISSDDDEPIEPSRQVPRGGAWRPAPHHNHNQQQQHSSITNLPSSSSQRLITFPSHKSIRRRPDKLLHVPVLPSTRDNVNTTCLKCKVDVPHPPVVRVTVNDKIMIDPLLEKWATEFTFWVLKLDSSRNLNILLHDIKRMLNIPIHSKRLKNFINYSPKRSAAKTILSAVQLANDRQEGTRAQATQVERLIRIFVEAHHGDRNVNVDPTAVPQRRGPGPQLPYTLLSKKSSRTAAAAPEPESEPEPIRHRNTPIEISSDSSDDDETFTRPRMCYRNRTAQRWSPAPISMGKRPMFTGLLLTRPAKKRRIEQAAPVVDVADEQEEEEDEATFRPVAHIFKRHSTAPQPPHIQYDHDEYRQDADYEWHCWFLDFLDWCLGRDAFVTKMEVYKMMADATNGSGKYRADFAQMGYRLDPQVKAAFRRVRPLTPLDEQENPLPDEVQNSEDDLHGLPPLQQHGADLELSDGKSDDDNELQDADDDEPWDAGVIPTTSSSHTYVEPEYQNDFDDDKVSDDGFVAPSPDIPFSDWSDSNPEPTGSRPPSVASMASVAGVLDSDGVNMQLDKEELQVLFEASVAPLLTTEEIAVMREAMSFLKDRPGYDLSYVWSWMRIFRPDRKFDDDDWKFAYENHRAEVDTPLLVQT